MTQRSAAGEAAPLSSLIRRWGIRVAILLLALEAVYVIAGNIFLRTEVLPDLINTKPEKMNITWDSAVTYLPGFARVTNFELRSQTRKDQIYLHVAQAGTRISLVKLIFKTIHIRGVDAGGVDFRYRKRLDRPPKPGQEEDPGGEPEDAEFWPEIPGYSNPPDPKPEDLYPVKEKKHPWTIKITGAEVEGPVRVALGGMLIEANGSVGGGVTVKPRQTITIHRGRLALESTRVSVGPEEVTGDLALNADLRFEAFPAKGAKLADVLGGISGDLSLAGRLTERAAVSRVITPGVTTFGAGTVAAHFVLKKGIVRAGSEYSLQSEAFHLRVMDLDAGGSATVSGETVKEGGEHVSRVRVDFGEFEFVDPDDGSVAISGTGFELDAEWNGLSITGAEPAAHVELDLPAARIHDVGTFNTLIPEATALVLESGTGTVQSKLDINDRIATGTIDLVAEQVVIDSRDTPIMGDLEVYAKLAEGDLPSKHFDLSGTTIRLDKIVNTELSAKKQGNLDPWFCSVELDSGDLTFGRPMAIDGSVRIGMYDTRPVIALLKRLGTGPKWLSMAPNIKDVDGTLNLSVDRGRLAIDDLVMTGDGFEALGWVEVQDKKADGRIFVRFKSVLAGVSLDQGKAGIHLSKPRAWFDEQTRTPGPSPAAESPAGE
jgi:hypothetical protein